MIKKILLILLLLSSYAHADAKDDTDKYLNVLKIYETGNYNAAFIEFSKLANNGNVIAEYQLGNMYRQGENNAIYNCIDINKCHQHC